MAGRPTYFVRVGGCDYSCLWCDSAHAVLAEEVRKLPRLDAFAIYDKLLALPTGPDWLTISGGNPALYDLSDLVQLWRGAASTSGWGNKVAVETQGSKIARWFADVDLLTISPKPPSSGMKPKESIANLTAFMDFVGDAAEDAASRIHDFKAVLKVVVFDDEDYKFAQDVHIRWPLVPFYLSCGTAMGGLSGQWYQDGIPLVDDSESLLDRYRWLCEEVMRDDIMADAAVYPQLHALAWGVTTRGV